MLDRANYLKQLRHRKGISKRYYDCLGISYTREYERLRAKIKKAWSRYPGLLTKKMLQDVYEDNIKKYGTLTCYLCKKPITFEEDSLDHKIPASREGTNEYSNLAIAHLKCNKKKSTKTVEEYGKEILKK
jgi:5-methylcytosine-specific restriction endonuclease McrA